MAPLAESESVVQVAQVPVRAVIVWEYEGLRELFESELKEDNMAGVKTTVKVPEFDRENIQMYIDELLMWQFVTDVDKKKQGPLVWMSLPKDEPSNIKQFINDSIGIDNLSKDDGIDKLIEAMKKAFQQEGEIEAFSKWKEFDKVRRKEGEDVQTFVNRFNTAYNAIAKKNITIPNSTRSFILVQKASITDELERMVIHKVDFTKEDCYEEVARSLIRIMGDSKKVIKDDGDEVYVAELVEERLAEVMAGMGTNRWKKSKKNTGGKVGAGGATGNMIKKPINKKDDDGNRLRCRECKSYRHMKEQCKDKSKEDNKKNTSGEVMRCSSCDSKKHLLPACPHSWENMANFGEEESSDDDTSLFTIGEVDVVLRKHDHEEDESDEDVDEAVYIATKEEQKLLGGFGWNHAILDTGCNKSVAGMRWTEEYIQALSIKDRKEVRASSMEGKQRFKFGGGTVFEAKVTISAPVQIGEKKYKLRWHVVEAPIPLLWGKESMKKAELLLDLPNDRARVRGTWVDLITSKCDHYGLYILPKSEIMEVFEGLVAKGGVESEKEDDQQQSGEEKDSEEQIGRRRSKSKLGRNRQMLPEDEHKLFLKLRHIHRQLGHPCDRVWSTMLKDAGLWTKDISLCVERIHKECSICKQFANTPSNPVVSMLPATEPGRIVAVDLKEKNIAGFKFIFYGIDVFSKMMFGSFIKTKQTSEIVREFMIKYVQPGGMMPDKLWSDCGGEFNSAMLKDLCESLGIEVATGPAYTPTSNAVVERHHAVVDRILEKMIEERPGIDVQEALGWAIHSHNSYPGTHGWSPFQLTFGRNPRIPGVGNDKLPALSGTVTEAVAKHINNLISAHKNYREAVNLKKIKVALAHKIRSIERDYVNGEKVYYKREILKQGDRNKWSGPATVIGKHGNVYYISHQSSLLRVSPQRMIGIDEAEMMKNENDTSSNEQGTEEKTDNPFFQNSEDHMEFEIDQLRTDQQEKEQIASEENTAENEGINNNGNEGHNADNAEDTVEVETGNEVEVDGHDNEQEIDIREKLARNNRTGDKVANMMKNRIPVEGEPERAPKAGDVIQYLDTEGEWRKVTVTNRYSKKSAWVNTQDEEGKRTGIDLATGSWKYNVLAAECVHESCITFIPQNRWGETECVEAKKKEVSMWEKFEVVDAVEDTGQEPRILTKWILTEKESDLGGIKVKARLVVLGNMEEGLPSYQTQSPTCGKDTVRLLLTLAAKEEFETVMIDLTNAYFQAELSKRDKELYLVPPSDVKDEGMIWKVKGNLYGLRDGAANLRKKAVSHLIKIGGIVSKIDPCLVLFHKNGKTQGAATIWVDDYFVVGKSDFTRFVKESIEAEFTVGKAVKDKFKYLGIETEKSNDGAYTQSQEDYINTLEKIDIPVGLDKKELDEYGLSILRHGTGKLNWAAHGTRPELCYKVAELSTHFKGGNVNHLKLINKCIKTIQDEKVVIKYPKLKGKIGIIGFCDAALNNMDDGVSSGGGYIIFLVDEDLRAAPIIWTSTKIKRVVRSSLAAEALIAVDCADAMIYIKSLVEEIMNIVQGEIKPIIVTDSNNLIESLGSPHPVQEKRLRVDIASLQQDINEDMIAIRHVPGVRQVADILTKKTANSELIRKVLNRGSLKEVLAGIELQ